MTLSLFSFPADNSTNSFNLASENNDPSTFANPVTLAAPSGSVAFGPQTAACALVRRRSVTISRKSNTDVECVGSGDEHRRIFVLEYAEESDDGDGVDGEDRGIFVPDTKVRSGEDHIVFHVLAFVDDGDGWFVARTCARAELADSSEFAGNSCRGRFGLCDDAREDGRSCSTDRP